MPKDIMATLQAILDAIQSARMSECEHCTAKRHSGQTEATRDSAPMPAGKGHGGLDRLDVHRGGVVPDDVGGCCPVERSVGSVVIVEVDEPVVGAGALGF